MGYMSIDNLYKNPGFVAGEDKEVYVLEKIHGTSAHVRFNRAERKLTFFSGGEKHDNFVKLFDEPTLLNAFEHLEGEVIVVYGEAYGGKQQGMKDTYGPALRFVAFDVLRDGRFLDVPTAVIDTAVLGIEFVWWTRCENQLSELDRYRDQTSIQAQRNGIEGFRKAEGIVIRPLTERTNLQGKRVIYKHKRREFIETKTPRDVDAAKVQVLLNAQAITEEWVTEERLNHVLDKLRALWIDMAATCKCGSSDENHYSAEHRFTPFRDEFVGFEMKDTPEVIRAMLADIKREGDGEIEWTKDAERSVCTRAAQMFKKRLMSIRLC